MRIERYANPVERFAIYLEGEETSESVLEAEWDKLSIPEGWDKDSINAISTGVFFASNGIARFVRNMFYTYVAPMGSIDKDAKILPFGGKIVQEAYQYYPLVPMEIVEQAKMFFAEVYRKFKSEAYLSLWYNPTDNSWDVIVPEQKVSGGGVEYEKPIHTNPEYIYVGDIHSHAGMSAGHSGTDDNDEYGKRDGIHITLGSFSSATPTFSARVTFGQFVDKDLAYNKIVDVPEIAIPHEWMKAVTENTVGKKSYVGEYSGASPWAQKGPPSQEENESLFIETAPGEEWLEIMAKEFGEI